MAMTDNKGNYITHYNNYEKRASLASLETEQAKRKIREELSADEVRMSPRPSRKSSAKNSNNEKNRRPGSIENEKKAGLIEPPG